MPSSWASRSLISSACRYVARPPAGRYGPGEHAEVVVAQGHGVEVARPRRLRQSGKDTSGTAANLRSAIGSRIKSSGARAAAKGRRARGEAEPPGEARGRQHRACRRWTQGPDGERLSRSRLSTMATIPSVPLIYSDCESPFMIHATPQHAYQRDRSFETSSDDSSRCTVNQ